MKKTFVIILKLLLVFSFLTAVGCEDLFKKDDTKKTCDDAVNNIWQKMRSSSDNDSCDVLYNFLIDYGIYWPSGTTKCGYFYVGSSYYYYYIPYENYFKGDMLTWCKDGVIAGSYEGKWDQSVIDCYAGISTVLAAKACW